MSPTSAPVSNNKPEAVKPFDRQAEIALLGAMLVDNSKIDDVTSKIVTSDFYEKRHQEVFKAIVKLSNSSTTADIVTVCNQLAKDEVLEKVGGNSFLVSLVDENFYSGNYREYAKIVHEKAVLRNLDKTAREIIHRAGIGEDPKELMEFVDRRVFEIATKSHIDNEVTAVESGVRFLKQLDEIMAARQNEKLRKAWIRTGFPEVDKIMFRFEPGTMTILAGRPGCGKTALALGIGDYLDSCNIASDFFSCEMDDVQLMSRRVTLRTNIPHHKVRYGYIDDEEYALINRVIGTPTNIKFHYFTGNPTPQEIRRRLRRSVRERNSKFAVIDYVQLLSAPGFKPGERVSEMSFISRFIKQLSQELQIPIVALSQMNRAVDQRTEKEPQLSDLRETGAWEQDADNVIFVWHPYEYFPQEQSKYPPNHAHILVKKQRQGPTGRTTLYWRKDFIRFESMIAPQEGLQI